GEGAGIPVERADIDDVGSDGAFSDFQVEGFAAKFKFRIRTGHRKLLLLAPCAGFRSRRYRQTPTGAKLLSYMGRQAKLTPPAMLHRNSMFSMLLWAVP